MTFLTRRQWWGLMGAFSAASSFAQSGDGTGPAVGQAIPEFSAVDQHGATRSFADLAGPSGLLLLFHRSADW
jgi:hypothetical protein